MTGTVQLTGTFTATLAQSPPAVDNATLSTATAQAVAAGQATFNVQTVSYLITCDDGTVANVSKSLFDTYAPAATALATLSAQTASPAQPAPVTSAPA